jgi:TonB family protein
MMVKDLHLNKPNAIHDNGARRGYWTGADEMGAGIAKPLLLSTLLHVVALGGLFLLAAYTSAPRLSMPPAQMVQLVDLPRDGGGGASKADRETPQPPPKKLEPPPEAPKAEAPPESAPPEPKLEKAEKIPPEKPKEPVREPLMTLPTPKVKEPPRKEPPKREEKKPEPAPRALAERPPEKKKAVSPPQPPPESVAQREATARAPAERPGSGSGGRSGPGSGLALGGGSGMLSLDSANFPFTYYLRQVTGRIEENWVRPQQNLGRVVVYFRIKRDGTILDPQVYESSRNQAVDMLASGAIKRSEPFPPLPVEFGGDYLGIYLCFGLGGVCPGQKEG